MVAPCANGAAQSRPQLAYQLNAHNNSHWLGVTNSMDSKDGVTHSPGTQGKSESAQTAAASAPRTTDTDTHSTHYSNQPDQRASLVLVC